MSFIANIFFVVVLNYSLLFIGLFGLFKISMTLLQITPVKLLLQLLSCQSHSVICVLVTAAAAAAAKFPL